MDLVQKSAAAMEARCHHSQWRRAEAQEGGRRPPGGWPRHGLGKRAQWHRLRRADKEPVQLFGCYRRRAGLKTLKVGSGMNSMALPRARRAR